MYTRAMDFGLSSDFGLTSAPAGSAPPPFASGTSAPTYMTAGPGTLGSSPISGAGGGAPSADASLGGFGGGIAILPPQASRVEQWALLGGLAVLFLIALK